MFLKSLIFLALFVFSCLQLANLLPGEQNTQLDPRPTATAYHNVILVTRGSNFDYPPSITRTTTASQFSNPSAGTAVQPNQPSVATTLPPQQPNNFVEPTSSTNLPAQTDNTTGATTTKTVIELDIDYPNGPSKPGNGLVDPNLVGQVSPTDGLNTTGSKPSSGSSNKNQENEDTQVEWSLLFYSIFIVYVALVKLLYHNVGFIQANVTEPGMLMIFGCIWEIIKRQLTNDTHSFPRFKPRIFFYLFLPSTILESASVLSNKWLFLNLLPILLHSIAGTLTYAASLGFTIYSLSRSRIFNIGSVSPVTMPIYSGHMLNRILINQTLSHEPRYKDGHDLQLAYVSSRKMDELSLDDCLLFGTILSSIDSTIILGIFRVLQVNDKLYYLILGENLMNNAVVLVVFNLLLQIFNDTEMTVTKIYVKITQFFLCLIGSVLIGILLAGLALIFVRLSRKIHVNSESSHYRSQCQTMVETLLVVKLAYLTYMIADISGTSSIVGLATFGILQDQYIKHNLNLRSQLTLKQTILATRTLGYSLVYPLLGMLLVEVASSSQVIQHWIDFVSNRSNPGNQGSASPGSSTLNSSSTSSGTDSPDKSDLYWDFSFLSLVTLFTLIYRFVVVMGISVLSNLFTSRQFKIKFREQILVAYGGLKGPLAFALVNRLIEHQDFRDRPLGNKHLFMYTILSITLLSTLIKGSFIKPIVAWMQRDWLLSASSDMNTRIIFDHINSRLLDYIGHGLNSIIGRTKSSYDRFSDFHETSLKPWLARDGSNTNWLSVFYDNLILDEALNANCFYRSFEDPRMQFYWHLGKVDQRRRFLTPDSNDYRRRSIMPLDTINEDQVHSRKNSKQDRRIEVEVDEPNHGGVARSSGSIGHETRRRPQVKRKSVATDEAMAYGLEATNAQTSHEAEMTNDSQGSVLKELVMYNLRVDEATKRKHQVAKQTPGSPSRLRHAPGPLPRMLSSTSSDGGVGETDLGSWREKQKHLQEMERRLIARQIEHSTNFGATRGSTYRRTNESQPRRRYSRKPVAGTQSPGGRRGKTEPRKPI